MKSMKLLTKNSGFHIDKVLYDSIVSQFLASELIKKDIPTNEGDFRLKGNKIFSDEQIQQFISQTRELNKSGRGDQAAFVLSKVD